MRLAGVADIDLVVIDMPVSHAPFSSRRLADTLVSREFGRRGCGTHTPNVVRPGLLGQRITEEFRALGYLVADARTLPGELSRLVETYPHV
ncbi:MAG: DUF429 domain-containing protein, partial [Thermoleophilia bacterium]|nr:DUF429 domain-containing protein [Thermoleophilia bacterium]